MCRFMPIGLLYQSPVLLWASPVSSEVLRLEVSGALGFQYRVDIKYVRMLVGLT